MGFKGCVAAALMLSAYGGTPGSSAPGAAGGSGARPDFGLADTVQSRAPYQVSARLGAAPATNFVPAAAAEAVHYSASELDYFAEVALGAEYGTSAKVVRKWAGDVLVQVFGAPDGEDVTALDEVLMDLRTLMPGRRIERVEEGGNLEIHFAPEDQFAVIDPNYQSTNYGFFWVWWGGDNLLLRSRVLISTTDISQEARSHLIREEVTQSLGMMNDSWRYPESIYYQGWTRTRDYADVDRMVIEMLYRDEIEAGMTAEEALEVLRALPRPGSRPATVVAAG